MYFLGISVVFCVYCTGHCTVSKNVAWCIEMYSKLCSLQGDDGFVWYGKRRRKGLKGNYCTVDNVVCGIGRYHYCILCPMSGYS